MNLAGRNVQGLGLATASYPLGGAPPIPAFPVATIGLWEPWKAAARVVSGSAISELTDQSATSADLLQADPAHQPEVVSAEVGGRDVARFVRTSADIMRTGAIAAYNNLPSLGLFVVMRVRQLTTSFQYLCGSYALSNGARIEILELSALSIYASITGAASTTNKIFALDPARPWFAFYAQIGATGTRRAWLDGVEIGTATAGAAPGAGAHSNTVMGARFNDTFHADADFAVMAMTTEKSAAEVAQMFDWSSTVFGV